MNETNTLVVFTDCEPDDLIAASLLVQHLSPHRPIVFVVSFGRVKRRASLLHAVIESVTGAYRPRIILGTGGLKSEYTGNLIHSRPLPLVTISEYQAELKQEAQSSPVELILLTNPVDANVLWPELKDRISQIHVMGGWYPALDSDSLEPVSVSYNFGMQWKETRRFLEQCSALSICPLLYSSSFFAQQFNGYVNASKFPRVMARMEQSRAPSVKIIREAIAAWDAHVTRNNPEMVNRIGAQHVGHQFAPADVAVALGVIRPDLILKSRCLAIALLDDRKVTLVNGHISLQMVEAIDLDLFESLLFPLPLSNDE